MPTVGERLDSLESVLGQFIVHTDVALRRLENEMKEFKTEMGAFKDEMKDFKGEMSAFKDEMGAFKDEMKDFKDEMKDFKDEMKDFKDEVNEDRKRMNKQWGELANKMGTLVEDIVAPSVPGIAREYFGCGDPEDFMVRRKKRHSRDRSRVREFDVIALCDDTVIVNETKSTPRMTYIDDFIGVLQEFYDYFPEYRGKKIIPVFASLYLPEDVVSCLTRNNIYAMAMKDDTMGLLNAGAIQ